MAKNKGEDVPKMQTGFQQIWLNPEQSTFGLWLHPYKVAVFYSYSWGFCYFSRRSISSWTNRRQIQAGRDSSLFVFFHFPYAFYVLFEPDRFPEQVALCLQAGRCNWRPSSPGCGVLPGWQGFVLLNNSKACVRQQIFSNSWIIERLGPTPQQARNWLETESLEPATCITPVNLGHPAGKPPPLRPAARALACL